MTSLVCETCNWRVDTTAYIHTILCSKCEWKLKMPLKVQAKCESCKKPFTYFRQSRKPTLYCSKCITARKKQQRADHFERVKSDSEKYALHLQSAKIWRKENPEENKKHHKTWRNNNRDKIKARNKKYYQENKEQIKAQTRAYKVKQLENAR